MSTHDQHGHAANRYGRKRSPEYNSWIAIKYRCENPKNKDFARYGGRGIKVCERWRKSFEAFLADMGPKPTRWHMLERADNDKGYEPENCRWATIAEQTRNRGGLRSNRRVTIKGQTMCMADASKLTGIPIKTIHNRLNRGLPDEEACSPFDCRRARS
jgi:hypothetical protein